MSRSVAIVCFCVMQAFVFSELSGQGKAIDMTTFEASFPERMILFYMARNEGVLDELSLEKEKRSSIAKSGSVIGEKHSLHIQRVRDLGKTPDSEATRELRDRFMSEIEGEPLEIREALSPAQLARMRQIAFQHHCFARQIRKGRRSSTGRILLNSDIVEQLQLDSNQQDKIRECYVSLESQLEKLEPDDVAQVRELLASQYKRILEILDKEHRWDVQEKHGPFAQALYGPQGWR